MMSEVRMRQSSVAVKLVLCGEGTGWCQWCQGGVGEWDSGVRRSRCIGWTRQQRVDTSAAPQCQVKHHDQQSINANRRASNRKEIICNRLSSNKRDSRTGPHQGREG